ncbi:RTA1 domain protein [Ilyonectria robusta]
MANLSPTTLTTERATSTLELVTPICTTAVPGEFGHVLPDACNAHYGFYPSWQWNLVFAVAFGITTLIHIVQAWRFKKVRRTSCFGPFADTNSLEIDFLLGHHHGIPLGNRVFYCALPWCP